MDAVTVRKSADHSYHATQIGFLSAGSHTLTLRSNETTRYIDSLRLVDRDVLALELDPAPSKPRIRRARLRRRRLITRVIDTDPGVGCALRVFGGPTRETANRLLHQITPHRKRVKLRSNLGERFNRYYLTAVKSCSGREHAFSRSRLVTRRGSARRR